MKLVSSKYSKAILLKVGIFLTLYIFLTLSVLA